MHVMIEFRDIVSLLMSVNEIMYDEEYLIMIRFFYGIVIKICMIRLIIKAERFLEIVSGF